TFLVVSETKKTGLWVHNIQHTTPNTCSIILMLTCFVLLILVSTLVFNPSCKTLTNRLRLVYLNLHESSSIDKIHYKPKTKSKKGINFVNLTYLQFISFNN